MSAVFGELLTFGQENGPDVRLIVTGDERYARYETPDGYTAVYDSDRGLFCYAELHEGRFVSSGVAISNAPPAGMRRHLQEDPEVRSRLAAIRRLAELPPRPLHLPTETMRTLGPNEGLLEGRRLSTGSVRGLTILVEFQDIRSTVTAADVNDMLNGQNYTRNGNFCSAREYFRLVSHGKLDYTNDVVGPFQLSRNRQYYVNNLLVREALDLAVASGVDLRRYDSLGEGIVDALNILYAGQTLYMGELWPHNHYIELRYGAMRTYFYLLTSMGRSSADLSIGTFCHENGHLLCRFPDMYDYGTRDGDDIDSAGIGAYCLMGSGNHNNNGRTPSPVCAYLRELAGWCDNVVILNDRPGQVQATHGDYGTALKYQTDKRHEYFLIENRAKLGLDQALPSSGLAVYHCDTRGSNEWQEGTPSRHYQCALLQADGHLDLERNVNQGDGGDLFQAVQGVALSHTTTPSSRQWDRADSGLVISQVSAPDASITFVLGEQAALPTVRGEAVPAVVIPDNVPAGVSSTIAISEAGIVQHLKVAVDITHTYIGDLIVELVAPSGQQVSLHNRSGAGGDNLLTTYDSTTSSALAPLVGQQAQGDWVLKVRDVAGLDIGKLNRWSLELRLSAADQVIQASASPALRIPDNDPIGVSSAITISQAGAIRQAKVGINISHTYIGDLRVELFAPSRKRVVLHSQLGGSQDNLIVTYETEPGSPIMPLVGESVTGIWVLQVMDLAAQDIGVLNNWSLEFRT
jgi:M6 family metalloprotease-like protein